MGKVFISGGGTGGHFYPALSLSKHLKEEGFEVVFIGTKNGIEAQKSFPYGEKVLFDTKGVRGKGLVGKVKGIYTLLITTFKVYRMIKRERPKFSICFGGYASLPLGVASFLSSTALYIHEQNSIPSYTNLILSKFARRIFTTFEHSLRYFPRNKTLLTGMPLREEILLSCKESSQSRQVKNILVIGGSQGAKKINETVVLLAKELPDITFHLIKGKSEIDNQVPENVIIYPYIDNIQEFYKMADIVISRAGSGVVNELLACGKFAIYIPYPYAASDHQYYNVEFLKEAKLSQVIKEKDLTPSKLKEIIQSLTGVDLVELSRKLKSYTKLDASNSILKAIKEDLGC